MFPIEGFSKTLYYFLSDFVAPSVKDEPVGTEAQTVRFIAGSRPEAVVILPGLEGDCHRPYIRHIARWFSEKGFPVVLFNYRGQARPPGGKPQLYHAGMTEDIGQVLDAIQKEKGIHRFHFIGFSLGGSLVLNYLKAHPGDARAAKAILVSPPLHFRHCSRNLDRWHNRLFRFHLLRTLNRKSKALYGKTYRSFVQFENYAVVKKHGFRNSLEYYEKHSPHHFLAGLERDILIFNSRHDPLLSPQCLQTADLLGHHHRKFSGGHIYVHHRMEEVYKEMLEFMEG